MPAKILIIGAGPGGLAAALLLAHAGFQVEVFEQQPYVGGRTKTFDQAGFRFDLGPTFFLYPTILKEIFQTVGQSLEDHVELIRLDPQYRLIFGQGGELLATPNPQEMEQAIARLSPQDATGFRAFMAENREKLSRFEAILTSPFDRFRDLMRPEVLRALPYLRPRSSLDRELSRFFRDPRVRLAFTFQGKYVGMSPLRCPSLFSILAYLEYEHGIFHPRGGCGAVSQAMARLAEQMGVKLHLGEPVEAILWEGRRARGLRTARQTVPADALVINADFARAMTRLVPNSLRRRWTDRKLAEKKYSCSTFMMYLGLEGLEPDVAHHTIYLSRDYLANLADIEHHHRLSDDPSVYVQNACITDPDLAPEGHSTLYVLVPVTHQHPNVNWQQARAPFREVVLDQVERMGIRQLRSRIRTEHVITPDDWDQQHEIHRGATFNLSHNLGQMLLQRPHNRFEDLQSVYLVGGGTHPGSGLPVIYSSARIAAQQICDDLRVQAQLNPSSRRPSRRDGSGRAADSANVRA